MAIWIFFLWFIATFFATCLLAVVFTWITTIVLPVGFLVLATVVLMSIAFYIITSFME